MTDIKIIALGGVRENGKNMYLVEVNDQIFVLDAGLKYPENDQLGVDAIVPNMDYLVENKDRIVGVFLTHGHADAIGALPNLLKKVRVPVFGSHLTIELAKIAVNDHKGIKKFNDYHVIDQDTEIDFDNAQVSFFSTTHTIPESLGIVIKTAEGNIIYTGDFKFDQTAGVGYRTDLSRLAQIGQEGVIALLSDSANADSHGQIASHYDEASEIMKTISDWEGRVIVACVSSNIARVQQIINAAAQNSRRIVITGRDTEKIVRTAIKLKKLVIEDERIFIRPKDMEKFDPSELLILESDRMGEPINNLHKMAIGRHRFIDITEGDLVYIVTTPSISKEAVVARVMNEIYQAEGVVKSITDKIHVSGHANSRDLQMMINLLKPKHLFPVQGEYRQLDAHAKAAIAVGMDPGSVSIVKRGDIMRYEDGTFLHEGAVSASDIMMDGNAMGDVGAVVLRDRKVLSEDGVFIVAMTISRREKRIIAKAKVHTRGFVYVKKSEELLQEAMTIANQAVEGYFKQENFEWAELKSTVRDAVSKLLYEETNRRPSILPVIMEVR